jgi:SAM-dependent methyltransferase
MCLQTMIVRSTDDPKLKTEVRDFWGRSSYGEVYAAGASLWEYYTSQRSARYALEPYIASFTRFPKWESFDLVYSWRVLHHSPNKPKVVKEVLRVLHPAGTAKVIIHDRYSLTGYMLWMRYALLAGRPFRSLDDIYFRHLESPGRKAYSVDAAKKVFSWVFRARHARRIERRRSFPRCGWTAAARSGADRGQATLAPVSAEKDVHCTWAVSAD